MKNNIREACVYFNLALERNKKIRRLEIDNTPQQIAFLEKVLTATPGMLKGLSKDSRAYFFEKIREEFGVIPLAKLDGSNREKIRKISCALAILNFDAAVSLHSRQMKDSDVKQQKTYLKSAFNYYKVIPANQLQVTDINRIGEIHLYYAQCCLFQICKIPAPNRLATLNLAMDSLDEAKKFVASKCVKSSAHHIALHAYVHRMVVFVSKKIMFGDCYFFAVNFLLDAKVLLDSISCTIEKTALIGEQFNLLCWLLTAAHHYFSLKKTMEKFNRLNLDMMCKVLNCFSNIDPQQLAGEEEFYLTSLMESAKKMLPFAMAELAAEIYALENNTGYQLCFFKRRTDNHLLKSALNNSAPARFTNVDFNYQAIRETMTKNLMENFKDEVSLRILQSVERIVQIRSLLDLPTQSPLARSLSL